MNKIFLTALAVIAITLIGISQALFTVDQTEQAIVLQLGQPKGDPRTPGLHIKIPFIQQVRYFDGRVLSVDPEPEQVVISSATGSTRNLPQSLPAEEDGSDIQSENGNPLAAPKIENVSGEPIIVDTFARYRITDPLQFLKTLGTKTNANSRIQNILSSVTKTVLGKTTLHDLLSEERTNVMAEIRDRVNANIQHDELGVQIVDVRIVRADLTSDLRTSTVRRMISELKERATETRAKGEERALEIRSKAEKERTVIIAEAQRDAQKIRGEGDRQAIKIYADAFNRDREFYAFIRSMEAYENTLATPDTRLILSPDSKFFRYFESRPQ
ncbi:MAG: protease modulator HflC [Alphaproteobacteria bacterium]|nr:protease modulator HflC [Alphaproteobacteria bacterium]